MTTSQLLDLAVAQKPILAAVSTKQKNLALGYMADCLEKHSDAIISSNNIDLENAKTKISPVMLDRLKLTKERVTAMANSLRDVIALPDPIGTVIEANRLKNGLSITKVSVPLGVLAMIYESRPNVTSDAAALSLKSGNVCVLRGGKEAINSNIAIVNALKEGLEMAGLPKDAICLVTNTSRDSATELMTAVGKIDMLIPRGGKGLIKSCVENAKVPCIETGTGICHIFIDSFADLNKALSILENAKCSRPSVCNAAEVCLVHKDIAEKLLPLIKNILVNDRKAVGKQPVMLRTDKKAYDIIGGTKATEDDFNTEFLDYILAIKVVDSVEDAITHIRQHSTGHSESIITENEDSANLFLQGVDSAAVYHNASTRFTDGGEFGLGCEMGISTQKLHARGPMGLKELTSYKYIVRGNGHTR